MGNNWKKYLTVFAITAAIFFTALFISDSFNEKRLEEIRSIEGKIAIDILSSETQFNLLSEGSCKDVPGQTALSAEISSLAEKLSFTEGELGSSNEEVVGLKKYYSLLQIKDYLLMKKISEKCGFRPITILYFYSNEGDCEKCAETGYVLTYLRSEYPSIRVYSFDYNLPLSAVKTLISILKVENKLPAIVVGEKVNYGPTKLEDFERIIPEIKKLKAEKEKAAAKATTTEIKK